MNSHAATYPLTGAPQPPTAPEVAPLVVTVLGLVLLVVIGAPIT